MAAALQEVLGPTSPISVGMLLVGVGVRGGARARTGDNLRASEEVYRMDKERLITLLEARARMPASIRSVLASLPVALAKSRKT